MAALVHAHHRPALCVLKVCMGLLLPTETAEALIWCRDDDDSVHQLTKGHHSTCTAAVAAARGRSTGEGKLVCQLCPGTCGLCPAAAAASTPPATDDFHKGR